MAAKRRCPAVYAGLMAGGLLIAPLEAQAAPLAQTTVYTSEYLFPLIGSFVVGSAIGAAIMYHKATREYDRALERKNEQIENMLQKTRSQEAAFAGAPAAEKILFAEPEETPLEFLYTPKHMKPASEEHASYKLNVKDKSCATDCAVKSTPVAKTTAAKPAAADETGYVAVAQSYVDKQTQKKRQAVRQKGVASVLTERLSVLRENMMEGIPVIERADGTVGDVGTDWWDEAVESKNKRRSGEGFTDYLNVDASWSAVDAVSLENTGAIGGTVASAFVQTDPHSSMVAANQSSTVSAHNRAETIASKVPFVEQEAYPAAPVLDEKRNLWQEALAAMDEKEHESKFAAGDIFVDMVGDGETLDEPVGLELETEFIPFKAPAGHPEVKDAHSYVDYLISQEFSYQSSKAVRRNAREFLRVIEGGTGSYGKALYVAEHFSDAKEA